ncbi:MAG: GNAT family N-acetyltransferase [Candidatus Limnocylindria bacterium]
MGRDDLAAAFALVRELYGLPGSDPEAHRERFDALVGDVDASPFLATAEGEPAGLILFRFRRRLNHATFEGWVSELVVAERFRRRGIGRMLMAAAVAEWRLRGGHQVMLEVAHARPEARALYASSGFEERGKYFEIAPVRTRAVEAAGVEIRPVRDEDPDFEASTRLLAELGRPSPTDEKLPALRRTYASHVARPETSSMLALLDGVPVGFVSLEFRQPFFLPAPQAWIPDLLVTESARGRKVGAALLEAAFEESIRRNAYAVALESGSHRAVAHRLYETAGMIDVGTYWTLA